MIIRLLVFDFTSRKPGSGFITKKSGRLKSEEIDIGFLNRTCILICVSVILITTHSNYSLELSWSELAKIAILTCLAVSRYWLKFVELVPASLLRAFSLVL